MALSRLAVITGGTGYLGSAIQKELQKHGWSTVSFSLHPKNESDIACDVRKGEEVEAAIRTTVEKYGAIDACIHAAAAPLERVPASDASPKKREEAFLVAVSGAENLAKSALSRMKEGGAFIGITTAAIAKEGSHKLGAYPDAKSALRDILRTLSSSVSNNVRVLAFAPAFLPGGLNRDIPEKVRNLLAAKDPFASVEKMAVLLRDICTYPDKYKNGTSVDHRGVSTPL